MSLHPPQDGPPLLRPSSSVSSSKAYPPQAHVRPASQHTAAPSEVSESQRILSFLPVPFIDRSGSKRSLQPPLNHLGYYGDNELHRDHDLWSLTGVCVANIGFLQGTLFGVISTTSLGGSSMLAWAWPISGIFMAVLSASMAEFGSAYPVAGAMFTWVWKLSRGSSQFKNSSRFLSWIVGSFLLCGHILSQILLSFQFATALQGTIIIFAPSYEVSRWTTVAIAWAEIALVAMVAAFPISRSPWLWKAVLLEILCAFFLLIGFLAASPVPHRSASSVFFTYANHTGWHNKGYVYLLGWASTCLATGQDVACHLSEETKRPARTVPLACFWSVVIAYALGWVSICVLLASIPTELILELQDRYFAPGVILAANMHHRKAAAVLVLTLIAMFAQGVAQILASSRYAYALARDKALPFSPYLSRVSRKAKIPHFAIGGVFVFTFIGLLLVTASSELISTFVLSGCGVSILFSYAAPSFFYLFVKDKAYLDGTGWRWTLRSLSKPVSVITLVYAAAIIVALSFPSRWPIKAENVGWAPVVFCAVLITSCLSWALYGNGHYAGPIKIMLGPLIELPSESPVASKTSALTSMDAHGKTARLMFASGEAPSSTGYTSGSCMESGFTSTQQSSSLSSSGPE